MQSLQDMFTQAINVRLTRIGKSKSWLADEIGMSQPALSARLNNKTALDANDLDKIAKALGVDGGELLALAIREHEWAA